MQPLYYLLVLLMLVTACTCNNNRNRPSAADTTIIIPDTLLVLEVDTENKTTRRFTEVPDSAFTPQRVINGLNQRYPEVQIRFIRQANDTLFIAVPQNEYLGERMGSTGSSAWFADVVLNLTAIGSVQFVYIDMPRSSHALPGLFKKEDFPGYTEVRDSVRINQNN